jgi:hypothetical protein
MYDFGSVSGSSKKPYIICAHLPPKVTGEQCAFQDEDSRKNKNEDVPMGNAKPAPL